MSFFRLTAPREIAPSAAETTTPETLFARMIRLWIEHNERVAQFSLLDR